MDILTNDMLADLTDVVRSHNKRNSQTRQWWELKWLHPDWQFGDDGNLYCDLVEYPPPPPSRYRVAWKQKTGHSGRGEWSTDKALILECVKGMNKQYGGYIHHWIEEERS